MPRFARALPESRVRSRLHLRIDAKRACNQDDRKTLRAGTDMVRAVRPRHRPNLLMPRGFLPLVVH